MLTLGCSDIRAPQSKLGRGDHGDITALVILVFSWVGGDIRAMVTLGFSCGRRYISAVVTLRHLGGDIRAVVTLGLW